MLKLLHGNNQFASLAKLQEIIKEFDGNVAYIAGDDLSDVASIFASTDSVSMFSGKQLTVVKRFHNNRKKISLEKQLVEKLQQRIQSSDSLPDLVFWEDHGLGATNRAKKPSAKAKPVVKKTTKPAEDLTLIKLFKEHGSVDSFALVQEKDLDKWLQNRLTQAGIKNATQFIIPILNRCGINQFILDSEVEKLSIKLKAEKRNTLSTADLDLVTLYEPDVMVWELTDAICSRNKIKALTLIDKMLQEPKDTLIVFSAVLKQFKLLYVTKKYPQDADKVKKIFAIKDYPFSKLVRYSYSFTEKQLQTLFSKLVNLDFSIKQGKIDSKLGLDMLIATL